MPRLHETPMGRRFFQRTMPNLADNLDRIATQMESGPERVFVLVGVYQGVIGDVAAASSHGGADAIEKDLCDKYGVPHDPGKREEHYEKSPGSNEVHRFEVELE